MSEWQFKAGFCAVALMCWAQTIFYFYLALKPLGILVPRTTQNNNIFKVTTIFKIIIFLGFLKISQ